MSLTKGKGTDNCFEVILMTDLKRLLAKSPLTDEILDNISFVDSDLLGSSAVSLISVSNKKIPTKQSENLQHTLISLGRYTSNFVYILVIITIISTIALFIYSNLSKGVNVKVNITANIEIEHFLDYIQNTNNITNNDFTWQKNYTTSIFQFTLASSIKDFWDSKAYILAILIVTLSGIWPYIKLLILLFVWIKPINQITREKIIKFIDRFGKLSFIDLFVTLYMILSFHFIIQKQVKLYIYLFIFIIKITYLLFIV